MIQTGIITANYVHAINGYQPAPWSELVALHRERFGPAELDVMLARVEGMGFSHVELWYVHAGECLQAPLWAGVTAADVLALFEKHGLQLASLCVGGLGSQTEWEPFFAFAQALGAPMLTGWLGREPALWERLAGYLMRYDTRYGIEPHGPTYSLTMPEEMLAAMTVSKRIGTCPDTGVWAMHGVDPSEGLEALMAREPLGRVIHMHLKGRNLAEGRGCAPGEDDIGLDRFVRTLRDAGYAGVWSLEYEADHDSDPEIARARRWLLEILAE
jgi:sugar phosphate isomerase/epimerase